MSGFDADLWRRIEAHPIGLPGASLTFADRLARENRWSPEHATRVILEYKLFCYLARTAAAGEQATPSDAVDQAWHLHLTYSRDYWEVFCSEVLRASLHHGSTAGGQVERARYYDQYAATLKVYEDAFGEPPPEEIWPGARRRFEIDPLGVRVNVRDGIFVSKPVVFVLAATTVFCAGALGWLLRGITE